MERKYLLDGRLIEVVETLKNNKYLVRSVYGISGFDEDECECYELGECNYCSELRSEEEFGEPFVVDKIFDKAPIEKYSIKISNLKKDIEKYKQELDKALNDTRFNTKVLDEQEVKIKENLDLLEKYEPTKSLILLLDGKATHFVDIGSEYEAPIIKKADFYQEGWNTWNLNITACIRGKLTFNSELLDCDRDNYRSRLIPCESYEEAFKIARDKTILLLKKVYEDLLEGSTSYTHRYALEVAEKYKVPVKEILDKQKELKQNSLTKEIEGLQRQLEEAKNKLKKID